MNDPTNGPTFEDLGYSIAIIKILQETGKESESNHVLYLLNEWQRSAGFARGVLEGFRFIKELEK